MEVNMSTEEVAVTGVIIVCWVVILIADTIVSGIISAVSSVTFKMAFLKGLVLMLVPPVFMAYGAWIGRERPQVKKIELSFDNLPEEFDGYRIVHLSDIHARSYSERRNSLQKVTEIVNGLEADLIAFTGDLITLDASEIDSVSSILRNLKAKDGVVSVLGNHDYCIYSDKHQNKDFSPRGPREVIIKERNLGWNLLLNESLIIYKDRDSIAVTGVENTSPSRHFPSKGNLTKASEGTEGMFRILLTHDPMHWEAEITGKDYPLTLSGHTHAMQLSLLGWSPSRYIFKQHRGLYTKGNQHLYVNIGLGETIIPTRIGARPEITLITLKSNTQSQLFL